MEYLFLLLLELASNYIVEAFFVKKPIGKILLVTFFALTTILYITALDGPLIINKTSFFAPVTTQITAHRSGSLLGPESHSYTIKRFCEKMTKDTSIEVNIQVTQDDKFIFIHDTKVDRYTSDAKGMVTSFSFNSLK